MTKSTARKKSVRTEPSKLLLFYIATGGLQALLIISWLLVLLWINQQSGDTLVGGSLVFGILFWFLFLITAPLALFTLIGLPLYIRKHKPQGKWLKLGIITIVITLIPVILTGKGLYTLLIEVPADNRATARAEEKEEQQIADTLKRTSHEIPKAEAIELLNDCDIIEVHYGNQRNKNTFQWGELAGTGIVIADRIIPGSVGTNPPLKNMSLSDALAPELVQIARDSSKVCGRPGIMHNGQQE